MNEALIEAALKELEWGQTIPFSVPAIRYDLLGGYRDFVNPMAGEIASRFCEVLRPALEDPSGEHSALLGDRMRLARRKVKHAPDENVVEVYGTGYEDPVFTVAFAPARHGFDLRVEADGNATEGITPAPLHLVGRAGASRACDHFPDDRFPTLARFSQAFFDAIPHLHDRYLAIEPNDRMDDSYVDILEADGFVIGDHCLAAYGRYTDRVLAHVGDWMALALPETATALEDARLVWGHGYAAWGHISTCSIPTDVVGRRALVHRNVSLNNDHTGYVGWSDGPEGGAVSSLHVKMVGRHASLADAIALLRGGELQPTFSYDVEDGKVALGAEFEHTNFLGCVPFYMDHSHAVFHDGSVERHYSIETNFEGLDPEDEFHIEETAPTIS